MPLGYGQLDRTTSGRGQTRVDGSGDDNEEPFTVEEDRPGCSQTWNVPGISNRLGVTHECDRQTDRQTDSLVANSALSLRCAAKNRSSCCYAFYRWRDGITAGCGNRTIYDTLCEMRTDAVRNTIVTS